MYLFAYGTLRLNANHPMADKINKNAKLIGLGYVKNATLYQIDWYPAFIESKSDKDIVIGDIFQLDDSSFLAELDEYENIGVGLPPYEYRREKRIVYLEHEDKAIDCWVYFYNLPLPTRALLIESGDFLNP